MLSRKMNNTTSMCTKVPFVCIFIIVLILCIDCKFELIVFNTIFLLLYVLLVLFTTVWISFAVFQHILNQHKPFDIPATNRFIESLKNKLFSYNAQTNKVQEAKIDDRIDDFVNDIERNYIRKWYTVYVSTDEAFLKESRNLIDIIVRRFLQISTQINSDRLILRILVVLLKHIKEYRRATKRYKSIGGSIESHYRYSHVGSKSIKSMEQFSYNITTKLLRHFINWELYNSLGSKCVTSIMSKKLVNYLLVHMSSPGFINYKILMELSEDVDKFKKYSFISISDVDHSDLSTTNVILPEEKAEDVEDCLAVENDEAPIKEPSTPINTRLMSAPVKIHESKSSNKTWRYSSDLDCISLGQDILDLDIPDMGRKSSKSLIVPAIPEDHEIFGNLKHSISQATTTTMKEIQQSTVNNVVKPMSLATSNAMHKIGDFQDEAAGVVEGLFDFGMAGIRKGLRLTGLQDGQENNILCRQKNVQVEDPKSFGEDTVWVNPLLERRANSSPSFDGEILLEKSPDSRSMSSESKATESIPIMEIDSPDPEYEDTTDLATTTAKLRSLLAQKTSESTPAVSPVSVTPIEIISSGSLEDFCEDGAPSVYKAWAKTATGVFQNTLNTLKTALPGNNEQDGLVTTSVATTIKPIAEMGEKQWVFVQEDVQSDDLHQHMEKFLAERQVFCTIDNAYEAVEAVELSDNLDASLILDRRQFDDELDDFDATIPMTKALIDLICELIEDTFPPLVKENVVKVLLLTVGNSAESKLHEIGEKLIKAINGCIGKIPKFDGPTIPCPMKIDELVNLCSECIPGTVMKLLNESLVKSALHLLLLSLQSHRINQDTNMQLMEVFASEITEAASKSSPTFSA
ncbi:PREDICTED: uncharacterized protein LOC108566375 isoform X2 [Nicrophorus vespilloides]|uniref:Uncharacterized protein LOC108566375 isoform X2 n=1 Tax=Nicrophorus vespilloides TaxID=110193 RepID=A0ABM1N4G4_NICVS|nr:PREDICTED: uncharacterized protein LOC108566375 isoform X2 [Nicrophorus vespilloides]